MDSIKGSTQVNVTVLNEDRKVELNATQTEQAVDVEVNEIFGTGVKSFTQTKLSEESHGENEVSVVLTNGATFTFKFYNGEKGEQGERGYGISKVQLNNDYTLTVTLENGLHFDTPSIRGEKGERGTGIQSVELREDYSLLFTLENGKTLETTTILGNELNNIRELEASAKKSADNAKLSEANSNASAKNASVSERNASEFSNSAETYATSSKTSAVNAAKSALVASTSEKAAATSETNSKASAEYATQTKTEIEQLKKETVEQTKTLTDSAKQEISTVKDATVSEVTQLKTDTISDITSIKDRAVEEVTVIKDDAKAEADKAKESETNAKLSETNASNSAKEAKASAESVATVTSDVEKLKEDLPNKITKFYASNQGETHITDSDNGKIQDMMIYGKSNQNQTKGKNLLKYPYIETTKTSNDITFTDNKDGSINVSGTGTEIAYYNLYSNSDGKRLTLASGTYKLVAKGRSTCNVFVNNGVNSAKNEGTFTITDGHNDVWCFIEAPKGLAIDETIYPMIQLASSTDESYEPYTGGKPSPNPDYPQEIKNVVNPTVKVVGKNLWKIYENGYINNINGDLSDSNIKTYGATDFIKIKKNIVIQSKSYDKTSNTAFSFRIGFYDSEKKWIQNIIIQSLSNPNIVDISSFYISKAEYIRVSAPNTIFDDLQIEYGTQASEYEPYKEQSIVLPITLNAIPVSSGGNVTINGQQYVADYVDVEKGKLYRKVKRLNLKDVDSSLVYHGFHSNGNGYLSIKIINAKANGIAISNQYKYSSWAMENGRVYIPNDNSIIFVDNRFTDKPTAIGLIKDTYVIYELQAQVEEDLTSEQVEALKMLSTYYPVTNITVGSEQLDGYTVFNYPISLANGWNYVKKQLNDNRDYIYDMDLQSAEAYVNSEYAVTLTELEV